MLQAAVLSNATARPMAPMRRLVMLMFMTGPLGFEETEVAAAAIQATRTSPGWSAAWSAASTRTRSASPATWAEAIATSWRWVDDRASVVALASSSIGEGAKRAAATKAVTASLSWVGGHGRSVREVAVTALSPGGRRRVRCDLDLGARPGRVAARWRRGSRAARQDDRAARPARTRSGRDGANGAADRGPLGRGGGEHRPQSVADQGLATSTVARRRIARHRDESRLRAERRARSRSTRSRFSA